jgi:hypothetical protein
MYSSNTRTNSYILVRKNYEHQSLVKEMATRKVTTFGSFRLTTETKWSVIVLQVHAKFGLDPIEVLTLLQEMEIRI